jgi:hypothetical protein
VRWVLEQAHELAERRTRRLRYLGICARLRPEASGNLKPRLVCKNRAVADQRAKGFGHTEENRQVHGKTGDRKERKHPSPFGFSSKLSADERSKDWSELRAHQKPGQCRCTLRGFCDIGYGTCSHREHDARTKCLEDPEKVQQCDVRRKQSKQCVGDEEAAETNDVDKFSATHI